MNDRHPDSMDEQRSARVNRGVAAGPQVAVSGFNVAVAGAVVPPCSPEPLVGAVAA